VSYPKVVIAALAEGLPHAVAALSRIVQNTDSVPKHRRRAARSLNRAAKFCDVPADVLAEAHRVLAEAKAKRKGRRPR
jgi:hypothetical protein